MRMNNSSTKPAAGKRRRRTVRPRGRARFSAVLTLAVATLLPGAAPPPRSADESDIVVLLHGLARGPASLAGLERALTRAGYRVLNVPYPSRRKTIERLVAEDLAPLLKNELAHETRPVHFVTHSLGGLLVREYLRTPPPFALGRIVMLAPPSQGSELADKLGGFALYHWINGPTGAQLTTGQDGAPARLPVPDCEIGIIVGTRNVNPLYARLIPGPNDGKVSVERAKLDGMADFLEVPHSHTWLMCRRSVQAQVVAFLASGRFNREEPKPKT